MISSSLPTLKVTNKDYTDLAIRLCDRRTGIGADGLAILVPSKPVMCACASSTPMVVKQKCAAMPSVALPNTLMNTEKLLKKLYHRNLGRCNEAYLDHRKWYSHTSYCRHGQTILSAQDIPMDVNMDKVIDVDLDVNGETVTVSSVLLGVPHTERCISMTLQRRL